MKRFISLLLIFIMVLALVPFSAFSVGAETDSQGVQYTLSEDGTYYIVSDSQWYAPSVVIPETYNGLPVKEIGDSAFSFCHSLTSIEIPNSVTTIGDSAFSNCDSLTSIEIPDSVTTIGDYAFSNCDSLETMTVDSGNEVYHSNGNCIIETATKTLVAGCKNSVIPTDGSVTTIGNSAFEYCESLTSIEIPNSVTSIGDRAFFGCKNLTSIEIPNSVTTIGNSAFYDCYDLESVVMGNSVVSIGDYAFSFCHSLTSIEIPDSVTTIGNSAFYDCYDLESVVMGNSVTAIGDYAFANCHSLTSIEIPDSVTYIGDSAFARCDSLTSIEIPDSVTAIGDYAFANCHSLTSIEIPDSVTYIGDSAFYGCDSLTSIEIPNSVTSIDGSAFYGCDSLTSIEIPNSVTSIGSLAFKYCDGLTDIYCEAESQPEGWSSFWNYNCSATVHWGVKMSGSVEEPETGDINGNGEIDSMDYLYLKRAFFKQYVLTDISVGDINKNGEIDSMDYLYLKRAFFKQYVIDNDDIIVDDSTPTDKPEAGEWTWVNGGVHSIIGTRGDETKTIELDINHLPDEYENEDGSYARLSVWRDRIFSYGDWIFYEEGHSVMHGGGGYTGSSTGAVTNYFRIKSDGTQQFNTNFTGVMASDLHIIELIGINNGELYYFLGEGFHMAGIPEYQYLYKIKIEDGITDLIAQGTLVQDVDFYQDGFNNSYIEDDWIYYYIFDSLYKIKLDGTENQKVEN